MNDELDIRSGGLVAVDTETLRHVAGALADAAAECAELAGQLRQAGVASMHAGLWEPSPAGRAEEAQERATRLARALRERAETYELIELDAERRAAAGYERQLPATLSWMQEVLASPGRSAEAALLLQQWRAARHDEIDRQLAGAVMPVLPAAVALLQLTAAVRATGRGVVLRGDPELRGTPAPVRVIELSRTSVTAPRSVEELAVRIPRDGDGRVRVETYQGASDRQHVVYVAGTRSVAGDDPWDMLSNLELYFGRASSSLAAVERALADAGARSGDTVHLVGHSQGGMIATHLARQGAFDVATLITFASPVQAQLGDEVLNVAIRHTDDPVVALADGIPGIAGSRDSFIVERVADPIPRLSDLAFGVHGMDAYLETAQLVDTSDDPRVGALRLRLAQLGAAAAATAVVYGARRDPARDASLRSGDRRRVSAS